MEMGIRIREMMYHKIKLNKIFSRITGKPESQVYIYIYVNEKNQSLLPLHDSWYLVFDRLKVTRTVTTSWIRGKRKSTVWSTLWSTMESRDWSRRLEMVLLRLKPKFGIFGKLKGPRKITRTCLPSSRWYRMATPLLPNNNCLFVAAFCVLFVYVNVFLAETI